MFLMLPEAIEAKRGPLRPQVSFIHLQDEVYSRRNYTYIGIVGNTY